MKPDINQNIAGNIRKLRILKGVEAKMMAETLGISLSGYTKIERGETQIDIERVFEISKKLDVKPIDILDLNASKIFGNNEDVRVPPITERVHDPCFFQKELMTSLMAQLKIKDEQLKAKDEMLSYFIQAMTKKMSNSNE